MQLEDYFNFLTPNDIRLKNSRIGIETILYLDFPRINILAMAKSLTESEFKQ